MSHTRIALPRVVNVGGTGKLPMDDLKRLCERGGLPDSRPPTRLRRET
ncbi:MAG: DUF1697 domain-containing protein [Proteobacteria bacterium]|nr:DUF1697 domain-containing protein [Pseudomonadota bacterium]